MGRAEVGNLSQTTILPGLGSALGRRGLQVRQEPQVGGHRGDGAMVGQRAQHDPVSLLLLIRLCLLHLRASGE